MVDWNGHNGWWLGRRLLNNVLEAVSLVANMMLGIEQMGLVIVSFDGIRRHFSLDWSELPS